MLVIAKTDKVANEGRLTSEAPKFLYYPVVVGEIYPVLGIAFSMPSGIGNSGIFFYFYRKDERMIYCIPSGLFEIVDPTFGENWKIHRGQLEASTKIGPSLLFEDEYLLEDLTNSEPSAILKMKEILHQSGIEFCS